MTTALPEQLSSEMSAPIARKACLPKSSSMPLPGSKRKDKADLSNSKALRYCSEPTETATSTASGFLLKSPESLQTHHPLFCSVANGEINVSVYF